MTVPDAGRASAVSSSSRSTSVRSPYGTRSPGEISAPNSARGAVPRRQCPPVGAELAQSARGARPGEAQIRLGAPGSHSPTTASPVETPRGPTATWAAARTAGSRPATSRGSPAPELLEPTAAAAAAAGPLSAREEATARRTSFDVSRTSAKPQRQILAELHRVLAAQHVAFRQAAPGMVRCQRHAVRFDIELASLDRLGSIHAVRFRRVAGELWQYKDICAKLLSDMKV